MMLSWWVLVKRDDSSREMVHGLGAARVLYHHHAGGWPRPLTCALLVDDAMMMSCDDVVNVGAMDRQCRYWLVERRWYDRHY